MCEGCGTVGWVFDRGVGAVVCGDADDIEDSDGFLLFGSGDDGGS